MTSSKRSSPQRFIDLYSLLKLKPLESDAAVIAAALKQIRDQLPAQKSPLRNESSAIRLAQLIELGEQHLLNSERKTRYDRQWRQHHPQPPPGKTAGATAGRQPGRSPLQLTGESPLLGLLPSGDPSEAFHGEAYISTEDQLHQPDIDRDFEQLQQALRPPPPTEPGPMRPRGEMDAALETGKVLAAVQRGALKQSIPTKHHRKQREKKILWLAIAGLTGLAVVLACGYRWAAPGGSRDGRRLAPQVALQPSPASPDTRPQPVEPVPRRSGLPTVQGIAPGQDLTSNLDSMVPVAPLEAATPQVSDPVPESEMSEPAGAMTPQESKVPGPTSPAAAATDQPQINDAERAAWAAAMQRAKQLIGQQQYEVAQEQLETAQKLVKTPLQQSQWSRLSQICTLAEEFTQALRRAIAGLSAGEVITIGSSTPVAIVDSTDKSLTIRMRGENREFLLSELPIGLAFALAELSLDSTAASTLARKAAFAWTHAGSVGSDVAAQRAREMLATAVAEGAADADLLQVFTDDYQVPEVASQSE